MLLTILQMLLKNLTSNAKKMMEMPNTTATMENMGKIFQKKHDVKSAITGVMVRIKLCYFMTIINLQC